jgi:hypothetical protein
MLAKTPDSQNPRFQSELSTSVRVPDASQGPILIGILYTNKDSHARNIIVALLYKIDERLKTRGQKSKISISN